MPTQETIAAPEVTVREARARYLSENRFNTSGYTSPIFPVRIIRFTVNFPNPGLLPYHDLHHVATGYAADLMGEAAISAFELRAGCGTWLIFVLSVGAMVLASFREPQRVLAAWRRARGLRSLYDTKIPYDTLLAMTVGELREHLGIHREGCHSMDESISMEIPAARKTPEESPHDV